MEITSADEPQRQIPKNIKGRPMACATRPTYDEISLPEG